MNYFTHTAAGNGFRAESAHDAANRIARREYGPRGYCASLRLDCSTEDGRCRTYQAFIGRDQLTRRNGRVETGPCSGRNVWIYETAAA